MPILICRLRDCEEQADNYVEQLATWHHNEWLHLNPNDSLGNRLMRYKQSLQTKNLPEIFVACDNKKLLGSVTLAKEDMDTRKHLAPWLASLFVAPENRQQGVASELIKYCIDDAKQLGYKNVYLFTEDQTQFYLQRGFRFVETVEYRQAEVDLMWQHFK